MPKAQRKAVVNVNVEPVVVAKKEKAKAIKSTKETVDSKEPKAKKVVEVIVLTKAQEKVMSAENMTISAKIRYLNSEGFGNSSIANHLNKRYQHVRNVLMTPMKRKVVVVDTTKVQE